MKKRKIKPNSYESYAEHKAANLKERIDLKKLWNEDVELDPSIIAQKT